MSDEELQQNITHEKSLILAYENLSRGYTALAKMPEHAKSAAMYAMRAKSNRELAALHRWFLAELEGYRGDE